RSGARAGSARGGALVPALAVPLPEVVQVSPVGQHPAEEHDDLTLLVEGRRRLHPRGRPVLALLLEVVFPGRPPRRSPRAHGGAAGDGLPTVPRVGAEELQELPPRSIEDHAGGRSNGPVLSAPLPATAVPAPDIPADRQGFPGAPVRPAGQAHDLVLVFV